MPLQRMAESGYDFVSLTVAVDRDGVAEAITSIARERAWLLANPDRYVLVESVDDIAAARQQGKLAVSLHFQGTNPVNYDVNLIEVYYRLGVRHMLLAYNARNAAGDGWFEPDDGGLSRFGARLIETMNRVGMMVDASHTGYRTTMEMFEVSSDPVVFSHANSRALHDHGRNIRDEQIEACARGGGVIGLTGCSLFLGTAPASPEAVADHVHHVAELVGAQHVGLGLDYVFGKPISITEEVGALLFVTLAFLSVTEGFMADRQVRIQVLWRLLPARIKGWAMVVGHGLSVIGLVIIIRATWDFAYFSYEVGAETYITEIPVWPWMMLIPASLAILVAATVVRMAVDVHAILIGQPVREAGVSSIDI